MSQSSFQKTIGSHLTNAMAKNFCEEYLKPQAFVVSFESFYMAFEMWCEKQVVPIKPSAGLSEATIEKTKLFKEDFNISLRQINLFFE